MLSIVSKTKNRLGLLFGAVSIFFADNAWAICKSVDMCARALEEPIASKILGYVAGLLFLAGFIIVPTIIYRMVCKCDTGKLVKYLTWIFVLLLIVMLAKWLIVVLIDSIP